MPHVPLTPTDRHQPRPPRSAARVATASLIGSAIEWYDFFIYGTAAALILNKLYFPELDPVAGTIAAFGTFAAAFLARPLGAFFFGHWGDRLGRKKMLVATVLLMGFATFAIGIMPTYDAIGPLAPIALVVLRLLQGFGVGGEWGGAAIMAVEHAPAGKRGFYGSWPQIGVPIGLVLASSAFALVSQLPEADFLAWGWRLPFLASIALVVVGLYIRSRVHESPAFEDLEATNSVVRLPIAEVWRNHRRNVLTGLGSRLVLDATFYIFGTFSLTYGSQHLGLPKGTILAAVICAATIEVAAIPFFGALSDRLGGKIVYGGGAALLTVWPIAFFAMMDTGMTPLVWISIIVGISLGHAATYGPQSAIFAELFPARVRYTGMSITYNLSGIVAGGPAPLIAAGLLAWAQGSWWPIVIYTGALGVLGVACTIALPIASIRRNHVLVESDV